MEEKDIERFTVGIESEKESNYIKEQQSKKSAELLLHFNISEMAMSLNRMLIEADSPMRVFMTGKDIYKLFTE